MASYSMTVMISIQSVLTMSAMLSELHLQRATVGENLGRLKNQWKSTGTVSSMAYMKVTSVSSAADSIIFEPDNHF